MSLGASISHKHVKQALSAGASLSCGQLSSVCALPKDMQVSNFLKSSAGQKKTRSGPEGVIQSRLAPLSAEDKTKDQRKGSDWPRVTWETGILSFHTSALSRISEFSPLHSSVHSFMSLFPHLTLTYPQALAPRT